MDTVVKLCICMILVLNRKGASNHRSSCLSAAHYHHVATRSVTHTDQDF